MADTHVVLRWSTHHHGRLNLSLPQSRQEYSARGLVMIAAVPATDTRKDERGVQPKPTALGWSTVFQLHRTTPVVPLAIKRDSRVWVWPAPFQFDGYFPEYNSPSQDGFHAASVLLVE